MKSRKYTTPFIIGLLIGSFIGQPNTALAALGTPVGGTTLTDSASLRSALSDETGGSGLAVFNSNPTLAGATLTGHLLFTDNTYDIGASGATRPRNIYAASGVFGANSTGFNSSGNIQLYGTRGFIVPNSDGVWSFLDNAGTSFGRLQFGGTTSSFPALKRNSTGLDVRLADDSAFAPLMARSLSAANGTSTAGDLLVANTYTSSTNNELWRAEWSSNVCYTGVKAGSGGGTERLEVHTGGAVKALTESTATGFVRVDCANDVAVGGVIHYAIYAKDAGDEIQLRSGSVNFALVNKAGAGGTTCVLGTVLNEAFTASSGTLTVSFDSDVSAHTSADIRATAVSSLTQTSLDIRYRVEIFGPSAVTTPL